MNATTWGRGGRAHPQTGQVAERVGEEPNQVQSASLSLAAVAVVPAPHLLQPHRATDKSGNQFADLPFITSGTVHFHCPRLLFALPAAHLCRQPRQLTAKSINKHIPTSIFIYCNLHHTLSSWKSYKEWQLVQSFFIYCSQSLRVDSAVCNLTKSTHTMPLILMATAAVSSGCPCVRDH